MADLSQLTTGMGLVFLGDEPISFSVRSIRYLEPDFLIGTDLEAQIFYAHRWDFQYETRINTIGGRAAAHSP